MNMKPIEKPLNKENLKTAIEALEWYQGTVPLVISKEDQIRRALEKFKYILEQS